MKRNYREVAGFTLIELLCVIGIIGILASLLIGAVSKAYVSTRNKLWRLEANGAYFEVRESLSNYYQTQITYPILTAADLNRKEVFNNDMMDLLRSRHVWYFPFSMSDATNKVIFQIDDDWLNHRPHPAGYTNYLVLMKMNVTQRH